MSKRILLADDSLTIQKVVELTFMDEDFEVDAVGSGDEAISRLEGELPSILIADVHMPGASGYEVCRQAKERSSSLPVLLLVGTFEALDEDEMAACGADGHLKKPFDSQELLQVVQRMTSDEAVAVEPPPLSSVDGLESNEYDAAPDLSIPEQAGAGFDLGTADLEGDPEIAPVDLYGLAPAQEARPEESGNASHETVFIEAVPSTPEAQPALGAEASVVEEAEESPGAAEDAPMTPAAAETISSSGLSAADVDRIAKRVVEMMGDDTVREVAWEVIPDLAEIVIKDRIRELEAEVE